MKGNDLQKASLWKRFAAGLFDAILVVTLAVGLAFLLSWALGYDGYSQTLDAAYEQYEKEYGISFSITPEEYEAMSEAEKKKYDDVYALLAADEEAAYAYNMMVNLTMVIVTVGILLAVVVLELVVPLIFGNGQTLGKKMFNLSLMRTDSVQMNTMQLFVRTVLGKYVLIMIPVYIVFLIFWGVMGVNGTLVILALLAAQIIIMAATKTNSLIHDLLAGTVVVDHGSQMIFRTTEDLIAYQKRVAAEKAALQPY